MKMNVDLIREILLWCEENTPNPDRFSIASKVVIKDYTQEQITYHFALLIDKAYIKAVESRGDDQIDFLIQRLTFDGHQYLEAIKSDTIWKKYREIAKSLGMEAVQFALPILREVIKDRIANP